MAETRRQQGRTAGAGGSAGTGRGNGLLARLLGWLRPGEGAAGGGEGEGVETDGVHAVVALEWATAESVVTCSGAGGGFAAVLEDVQAAGEGTREVRHHPVGGAREALALGLGLAEAGERVTVLLAGLATGRAAGVEDLLGEAGRRRLPLVIHALGAPPVSLPGVIVLAPSTVQELVDWTLLARALAERALGPVVVLQDEARLARRPDVVTWPAATRVERFLGRPEDGIHSPGVQQLTHGEHRRRLPVMLDGRRPMLFGTPDLGSFRGAAQQDGGFGAARRAAGAVYLDGAVASILEDLIERFTARFGRRPEVVRTVGRTRAGLTVVASGPQARVAEEVLNSSAGAKRWRLMEVVCLAPAPVAALTAALTEGVGETGTMVVLEPPATPAGVGGEALAGAVRVALERGRDDREDRGKASRKGRGAPRVLPVTWGGPGQALRADDLASLLSALEAGDEVAPPDGPLWLGMDFAPRLPAQPKRQVLHDAVRRLAPGASRAGWTARTGDGDAAGDGASVAGTAISSASLPAFIRRLGTHAEGRAGLASLPRFVDQVLPLTQGEAVVVPDPQLAFPVLPPLSAVFRPPAPRVGPVPRFDPAACTGCGACWTSCPHGAFEPRVLSPKDLLNAGLDRARETGEGAEGLRRVLSRLGKELGRELSTTPGGELGDLLDRAFARLPAGSRAPVTDAFAALRRAVGDLPVSRTEVFGDDQAFLLGLDPVACTGCGQCVQECEPGALTVAADADGARMEHLEEPARRIVATLRELPAPSAEVLERVATGEPGELGAALLAAEARGVMVPGEGAPAGSPEALALRRHLALAVVQGTTRLQRRREWVEELREALSEALRGELAGALPAGDLDALAQGVAGMEEPEARLGDLLERVEEAFDAPRVDVARLRRRVELARRLANRYPSGDEGREDAPCALVLGPGRHLEWAASYPWNPFAVPVGVAADGDGGGEARGLALGWRRRWQAEGELLAEVAAELGRPIEAAHDAEPPPLVLVLSAPVSEAEHRELEAAGLSVVVLGESVGTGDGEAVSEAAVSEAAVSEAAVSEAVTVAAGAPPAGDDVASALARAEEGHRAELARQLADLNQRWHHHLAREKAAWQQAVAAQVRQRLRSWAGLEVGGLTDSEIVPAESTTADGASVGEA